MPNAKKFLKHFRLLNSGSWRTQQRSPHQKAASGDDRFQIAFGQRVGFSLGLAGAITFGYTSSASAQTAITNLNATYQRGTSSSYSTTTANPCGTYSPCGSGITLNFGVGTTNDLRVSGFRVNADNYSLIRLADSIQFQRINNAAATGRRNVLFFEQVPPPPNPPPVDQIRSTYTNSVEAGILGDISNRGIDNAFSNVPNNVASNNVERIDYIVLNGLTETSAVQSDIGFLVLERGGNDPFKIAAITSLDANGKPASYGPLRNVANNAWGLSGPNLITAVMRREENEPVFRPSHIVPSQPISGIFFSLTSLGALPGQTIYGYSLFANDVPAGSSSNNLVNLIGFPTDTSDSAGGLDLVAGGGIYLRDTVQSVSGALYTDANADNTFNAGEPTLPNSIEVILYKDNNNNGRYDVGEQVQTTNTAGNKGQYTFINVANGTYRVFVNTSDTDIPSNLSLSTPNDVQVVVSNNSRSGINFGFRPTNDYGDAPSTYGDASHLIALTPAVYLGNIQPDSESSTQLGGDAGASALGDDSIGIDDEDAFTTLPNTPATGTYNLTVPVTNKTGGNATLHAWIDFNNNKKFEAGEYQTAVVGNNAVNANISWNVPTGTPSGKTYARFRLTTGTLTDDTNTISIDERSIGNAADGEVEDYQITVNQPTEDYGDAPDAAAGTGIGNYRTTLTDNGPRHTAVAGLRLGTNIDSESGTLQNTAATADDNDQTPKDEDAFTTLPNVPSSGTYSLSNVPVVNSTGSAATLHAWVDFNKNGSFEATEYISTSVANGATSANLSWVVPSGTTAGTTYARFRLSTQPLTDDTTTVNEDERSIGPASNGEVEDYQATVVAPTEDYGDAPDTAVGTGTGNYKTTAIDNGPRHTAGTSLRLGTNIDSEFGTLQNTAATADDNDQTPRDEDAFTTLPNVPSRGTYSLSSIPVVNSTGNTATLHAWVDFNKNGSFEATEYVSTTVANGATSANLNWTVPSGTTAGTTYARFRLSTQTLTDDTATVNEDERSIGAASNGEVEDYQATVVAPTEDYGDAPDAAMGTGTGNYKTTLSDNGPRHTSIATLKLGTNVDSEFGTLQNATATADDNDQTPKDEDAFTTLPNVPSSGTYSLSNIPVVNSTGSTATLHGWVDFNKNGSFEATEYVSTTVANGATSANLSWTVPNGTTAGTTYARFRLSTQALTDDTATMNEDERSFGSASNGEVEDYQATVVAPTEDYGDAPDTAIGTGTGNYKTTLSDNGPRHTAGTSLRLGTNIDSEFGTLQNATATADDNDQTPKDEDAFSTLPSIPSSGTYSLNSIPVVNSTGSVATLHGWIDFNKNGSFEATEYVSTTVANGASSANLSWTVPNGTTAGTTYARFRLSTQTLTDDTTTSAEDERSIGVASNGEVEDYQVAISAVVSNPNVLLVKRITAINSQTTNPNDSTPLNAVLNDGIANSADDNSNWPSNYLVGALAGGLVRSVSNAPADTVEYSIYFLSAGNAEAKNVLLCDRIPQYTTFLPNAYASALPASPLSTQSNPLGMALAFNGSEFSLTGAADGDAGYYFPANTEPSSLFPSINCNGPNDNGAIVVNLGSLPSATAPGQPTGAFGRLRFQVTID